MATTCQQNAGWWLANRFSLSFFMKRFSFLSLLLAAAPFAEALTINLDYSFDSTNFFGTNTTAKAALEAAASDLSAVIQPSLGAVSTDIFTGTNGSTSVTADWFLTFHNPTTGSTVTLSTFTFAANSITIYAGASHLAGATLGEGGSGGAGFNLSGSISSEAAWPGAVANLQAASNTVLTRSSGPVIGSLSGNTTVGSTTASYQLDYGALIGAITFDDDTDNNGAGDNVTALNNYWHFDHTTSVAAGKNDFYSVALHELVHALGIGSSDTWQGLASGTTWTGANAIALNGGTGANLLSLDGGHLASSFMSTRLTMFGGGVQEVALDPSITTGTRKYLTEMDAAFLRDLGYAAIPEPSSAFFLAAGTLILGLRRRSRG